MFLVAKVLKIKDYTQKRVLQDSRRVLLDWHFVCLDCHNQTFLLNPLGDARCAKCGNVLPWDGFGKGY